MKHKRNVFLLLTVILLAGCATNKSEDSSLPSENSNSSVPATSETSDVSSSEASSAASSNSESSQPSSEASSSSSEGSSESSSSSEGSSEASSSSSEGSSSSEELPPLDDPDIPGLTRSDGWPSAALYEYLTYTDMFNMPELTSETSFHHGLYNDELFYRVVTRVRTADAFTTYKNILEEEYDFIFKIDEYGDTYGETYYGEVQLNLYLLSFGKFYEVAFDFYDGEKYVPQGLVAVDNVALFNFRNREAVVDKKPDQVKWKVDPVTFSVSRGSAGYPVGNTNYQHISNPLRIYAGNILRINVENQQFYIKEIQILASSGYAQDFVDEGEFDDPALATVVKGDWITITTNSQISALKYERQNVTYVGQVRLLSLKVTIAKK